MIDEKMLALRIESLEKQSAHLSDAIAQTRRWMADCTRPALAEPKMSREFCRCERCCDRRERRSGVERRTPFETMADAVKAGLENDGRRDTLGRVRHMSDGRVAMIGRRSAETWGM